MVFFRTSNGSFSKLDNDNYFEIRIQSTSNENEGSRILVHKSEDQPLPQDNMAK